MVLKIQAKHPKPHACPHLGIGLAQGKSNFQHLPDIDLQKLFVLILSVCKKYVSLQRLV